MYFINILESVASFILYFVILTLSLSFWGKQTRRLLRFKEPAQYGDMRLIVAAMGAMFFLSQAAIIFLPDYFAFLIIYFIVGLAGSLIEILFYLRKKTEGALKLSAVKDIFKTKESFFISIITAAVLAFFYSAVWPSGQLDLWMNNGLDFYTWIATADYLLGGLNNRIFDYSAILTYNSMDAVGSLLLIDFIAAAKNLSPLLGAPSCALTLLIWQATAMAGIFRKIFGFGLAATVVLSLGWVLGSFANYVAIVGMFGQLVGAFLFLAALGEFAPGEMSSLSDGRAKKLFLPLFCLLIAYQGGYGVYAGVLVCVGALSAFLNCEKPSLGARLSAALKIGLLPVLLVTVLCMVVMPGFGHEFIVRLRLEYQQSTGWSLPFLSPLLFLGVPYYSQHLLLPSSDISIDKANIIPYIPLILSVIFLTIGVNHKRFIFFINKSSADKCLRERKNIITTLSLAYLVGVVIYLASYLRYGHLYKVWKFVSFTALPLSFIPISLLVLLIIWLSINFKLQWLRKSFCIFCLAIYLCLFVQMPGLLMLPHTYYGILSARPFINDLFAVQSKIQENKTLLVDLIGFGKMTIVPLILKNNKNLKINFIYPAGTFASNPFYNYSVDEDTIIISDVYYPKIYRAKEIPPSIYEMYFYDFNQLEKMGMASINTGVIPYDWKTSPTGDAMVVAIKIPLELRGLPLKFSMDVGPDPGTDSQNCRDIGLDLMDGDQVLSGGVFDVNGEVSLDLSVDMIRSDFIKIMVFQTATADSDGLVPCVQRIRGVDLEKLDSGL
jgi:hypothetical protein